MGIQGAGGGDANGVGFSGKATKAQRVTTGSVAGSGSVAITLTWAAAFSNANYSVSVALVEPTATTSTLRIHHVESISASQVVVRVVNDDAVTAKTGTLHVVAVQD